MKDDDPDSISLDSQVKLPSDSEQFDLTAYAVAVAFNNASLPPDMPEWLKGIITGQAAQLRDSPEGVSRFNELSAEQARKSRQSDADERTEFQLGVIAQEQRQREEWLRTTHSLGNTTLTGAEWAKVADDLKAGSPGREWLLAYLAGQGRTADEAKQTADDLELAAKGMSKPERDRTKDEQAAIERVEADPKLAATFDRFVEAQQKGFPTTAKQSAETTSSAQVTSIEAGADALELPAFAGAPSLSEHYRAATFATEPLEAPKQGATVIIPAAQPVAAAGLDV